MQNLPELTAKDVENKICLARVDFNSCFENGKIKSDFRIKKTMPTIEWLIKQNCRIILMTHIEENDGTIPHLDEFFKLWRRNFFDQNFQNNLHFTDNIVGEKAKEAAKNLRPRHILLLDNLRLDKREIANDEIFSRELASLGEVYINEAFSVSHRNHASIVGLPKFLPSFAGFNFRAEIENLSRIFNPEHPFLVFIGGKKVVTKEKVIETFLKKADAVILSGMMAVEFLAAKGENIGGTPIDKSAIRLIQEKFLNQNKIVVPDKFIVASSDVRFPMSDIGYRMSENREIKIETIKDDDVIYDVAPEFFESIRARIKESELILWSGPTGFIEAGFAQGTKKLISLLIESEAKTIIGGGDTIDFIDSLQLTKKFSFVSTGGGAMLEFLADETLPGIEALR